ncbi:MAG: OmpA family protein [Hyphomonadaceae bacterium]
MKKMLQGATALAAILIGAPAAANAAEGWYGRADVGYTFDGDVDVSKAPTPAPVTLNGQHDFDADWSQHLGVGYGLSNGFRLEGELGHRYNELETSAQIASGGAHAWSYMINAFYDFNRGGSIQPYLGVGVGGATVVPDAVTPTASQILRTKDTGFAWQGLAGVGFALTPRLMLDVGYRYFAAPDLNVGGTSTVPPVTAASYDLDYTAQSATIGLRWSFAAPPPPPPPPAPPPPPPEAAPAPVQVCPAQDFKVYFAWDKSALDQTAIDTINNAVARAKACNVATVRVVGYTDTSGRPDYNVALSQRRATVVADALVAGGIPTGVITTEGAGETNLDKATADGVREPLNRRSAVTISFQ